MKLIKTRREQSQHLAIKEEIGRVFTQVGYPAVLCEFNNADAWICAPTGDIAVEAQNFAKHTLHNLHRDFANGARCGLVVASDLQVLRAIASKLARELPPQLWDRVGVMTLNSLRLLVPPTAPRNP